MVCPFRQRSRLFLKNGFQNGHMRGLVRWGRPYLVTRHRLVLSLCIRDFAQSPPVLFPFGGALNLASHIIPNLSATGQMSGVREMPKESMALRLDSLPAPGPLYSEVAYLLSECGENPQNKFQQQRVSVCLVSN